MSTLSNPACYLDGRNKLWEACLDWKQGKYQHAEYSTYSEFYEAQLRQLDVQYTPTGDTWPLASKSYSQITEVVRCIRVAGEALTLSEMRECLCKHFRIILSEPSELDSIIFAALRIWLVVNFRQKRYRSIGNNRPCVVWNANSKLRDTLKATFPRSKTRLTLVQRRLSHAFTIANMAKIHGLKVEWASTLDDHLTLDRQRKTLWVFADRDWLSIKVEASKDRNQNSKTLSSAPLPLDLYQETNRTLDLLFPGWDKSTQRWLKQRKRSEIGLPSQHRLLDLKHYSFWRDRLLELNEDIFLADTEGLAQIFDRRDLQKFWTFWIALTVFFLTMVSTIASILQTVAAWKQISS